MTTWQMPEVGQFDDRYLDRDVVATFTRVDIYGVGLGVLAFHGFER